ncbi:TPA: TIM barrel protein [Candidatus Scatousia excrementigallinarum]|uniref:TIM barrel protein n=1 Tax=Candidatus Scatousia excrementigallinarum TaxID=2840935 RepID=A0A9D1F0B0_9BACT|nr:TIM barrel protein [Candidatus Scatousia excrementigallinarum]
MPLSTGKASYGRAFEILSELNLDGMELEFVHGVRMSDETRELVKNERETRKFILTAHAPFYVNLNSQEEDKVEASVQRIIETGLAAQATGAFSITFHAAFYMKQDKEEVYNKVRNRVAEISDFFKKNNINVWIRPETTGKGTQWGDLEEIIRLSKEFENVLPCIDFSHLHARSAGQFNTYDEFSKILETVGNELGQRALDNFHAHLAGIDYGDKGEKKHLILEESDMNYKDLLKVFKEFNVKGALVCESPNIEDDAVLLREYYYSI